MDSLEGKEVEKQREGGKKDWQKGRGLQHYPGGYAHTYTRSCTATDQTCVLPAKPHPSPSFSRGRKAEGSLAHEIKNNNYQE